MKILSDNSLEHLVSLIKSSIVTDYNNLSNQPIVRISGTENDPIYLRDLQTGAFILSGVCKPFNGSDESMTANSAITFVNHFDAVTAIQIFYPPYNQIQYFEVYDNTYTSKVVALNNMADKLANIEDGANKYTLPEATADTLGGVKVGSGLEINNGVLSATATGTGNVSSDTINSIVVVDSLPDVEEEGVLYLVKETEIEEPTIEYVTNPTMEMGTISNSTGALVESSEHCRTADYVYIKGKPTLTLSNSINASMYVVCYDENKNFMTNWYIDDEGQYSYKRVSSGGTFTFPEDAYYIKLRFSSAEIVEVTITYE